MITPTSPAGSSPDPNPKMAVTPSPPETTGASPFVTLLALLGHVASPDPSAASNAAATDPAANATGAGAPVPSKKAGIAPPSQDPPIDKRKTDPTGTIGVVHGLPVFSALPAPVPLLVNTGGAETPLTQSTSAGNGALMTQSTSAGNGALMAQSTSAGNGAPLAQSTSAGNGALMAQSHAPPIAGMPPTDRAPRDPAIGATGVEHGLPVFPAPPVSASAGSGAGGVESPLTPPDAAATGTGGSPGSGVEHGLPVFPAPPVPAGAGSGAGGVESPLTPPDAAATGTGGSPGSGVEHGLPVFPVPPALAQSGTNGKESPLAKPATPTVSVIPATPAIPAVSATPKANPSFVAATSRDAPLAALTGQPPGLPPGVATHAGNAPGRPSIPATVAAQGVAADFITAVPARSRSALADAMPAEGTGIAPLGIGATVAAATTVAPQAPPHPAVANATAQIAAQAQMLAPGQASEIRLRLRPPDLGEVQVQIRRNAAGALAVHLFPALPEAAQVLNANLEHLRAALTPHSQGAAPDVTLEQRDASGQSRQHQQGQAGTSGDRDTQIPSGLPAAVPAPSRVARLAAGTRIDYDA